MIYLKSREEFINESFLSNAIHKSYDKVIKEVGSNFYFSLTFSTSITALYPLIENLIKNNNLSNTLQTKDIILLIICALAVLFKENKNDINDMLFVIKEKGLSGIFEKVKDALSNLEKVAQETFKNVGKVITTLVDMFSYTAMMVPIIMGLTDIVKLYEVGFDKFNEIVLNPSGMIISTAFGIVTITLKHLITFLLKKVRRLKNPSNTVGHSA